jgi:hypothetical protein
MVSLIDNKKSNEYDKVMDLGFSSDGSKYGFAARKEDRWIVVINDIESNGFNSVKDLILVLTE